MANRKLLASAIAVAFIISTGASAQNLTSSSPGFHFFFKPSASIEDHNADLVACTLATRGLINGSDAMTGITAATGGGLFGAIIGGVIDNNENRQGAAANAENCMALRGWSVVGLTEAEGLALEKLDGEPSLLREALAPKIDTPVAQGIILRGPFANELAIGGFKVDQAGDLEEVSLSVRAVKDLTEAAVESAGELRPPKPPKGVKAPKPIKTVKESAISTMTAENAQIVLSMVGSRPALNLHSIILQRLDGLGGEVVYDGAPVTAILGGSLSPKIRKRKEGDLYRYDFSAEIPTGVWKVATINYGVFAADLCFGAPAFAIKKGETLYLGEMHLSDDGGYPLDQTNLDVARDMLAPQPDIAERVKFAALTNGFTSECFGSYAYAYEQPESPFVDEATDSDTLAVEIPGDNESTDTAVSNQ